MSALNHQMLQEKYCRLQESFPSNFDHRIKRSLSWLQRAEKEQSANDPDAAVIFYWIAFNAAYSEYDVRKDSPNTTETKTLKDYLATLTNKDTDNKIQNIIKEHRDIIENIVKNPFIFKPSGRGIYQSSDDDDDKSWKDELETQEKKLQGYLRNQSSQQILNLLFSRLYILRNQLLHGSATWGGKVNRCQITDGCQILCVLMPCFIDIMMNNHDIEWGEILYPVVESQDTLSGTRC